MAPAKKKIRVSDLPTLKPDPVQFHLKANYVTFTEFYKKLCISDVISAMVSNSAPFEMIENPSETLCRWRDTSSIPYYVLQVKAHDLEHLVKEKAVKKPQNLPYIAEVPSRLEELRFLESKLFKYTRGIGTNVILDGMNIEPYIEGLVKGEKAKLNEPKEKGDQGAVMFCGGPVSALAVCPRADASGREIVAVATFADELNLIQSDSPSTYLQLWSFASDLTTPAECTILLEVPRSTVIALEWCPVLAEHQDKCLKSRLSRIQKVDSDCLGLLAAATDKGVVFIYSIPRQLDDMRNSTINEPFIFRTNPVATLVHSANYELIHCIPIGTLKWSFYDGGARLLGVSDAGDIIVWDLDTKITPFTDPEERLLHMRAISTVYNPVTSFSDSNWDSPPFDACWMNDKQIVVTLRSRLIYLYSWPDMCTLLVDTRNRSIGQSLLQMPVLYDGCFCIDTAISNIDGIGYSGTCYMTHDEDDSLYSLTLFNRHQIQTNDAALSQRTGILTTVGMDGRLCQSLNARVTSREDDNNDRIFQYGRPLLHLIRLHRETDKENQRPIALKHEDCRQHTWLEVRAGDAALLDQATARKSAHVTPEALLDRRTEALTRVSASTITEGLVVAGGEAGLVFILPTLL